MAQEYFVNSQELENKIRQLLPSQGGKGAGQDLSASTQIVPIIDLTESAEGSNVRQDLQTAISHDTASVFNVNNATTTIITNTGYFRINGVASISNGSASAQFANINITDGAINKVVWALRSSASSADTFLSQQVDLVFFLSAGDSLSIECSGNGFFRGSSRQIAAIDGTLVNP